MSTNSTLADREFDLIIFGATGFAGYFIVRELVTCLRDNNSQYAHLKWAIAGRSSIKLDQTLAKLSAEIQLNLDNVPRLLADVANTESLDALANRTRILINAVGPYRFYGAQVIEACLRQGTHHLDITAEPQYVLRSMVDYYDRAVEKGVLVVVACGFDCIPIDVGVQYLKDNFGGQVDAVKTYLAPEYGPSVSLF